MNAVYHLPGNAMALPRTEKSLFPGACYAGQTPTLTDTKCLHLKLKNDATLISGFPRQARLEAAKDQPSIHSWSSLKPLPINHQGF